MNKVSVYGFGSFPSQGAATEQLQELSRALEPKAEPQRQENQSSVPSQPEPDKTDTQSRERDRKIIELYRKSITLYRAGQLSEARKGFQEVLKSGRFPAYMEKTIKGYIADINSALATDEQQKEIAELYYSSMAFYRSGQLVKARAGLTRVLNSGLIPPAMAKTIEKHLADINNTLAGRQSRQP